MRAALAMLLVLGLCAGTAEARQPGPRTLGWTDHNGSDPGIAMIRAPRPRR